MSNRIINKGQGAAAAAFAIYLVVLSAGDAAFPTCAAAGGSPPISHRPSYRFNPAAVEYDCFGMCDHDHNSERCDADVDGGADDTSRRGSSSNCASIILPMPPRGGGLAVIGTGRWHQPPPPPQPNGRPSAALGGGGVAQSYSRMARYLQQRSSNDDGDNGAARPAPLPTPRGEGDGHDGDGNKHGLFSGALHQFEHRAKEKTSIKLGEKAAERVMAMAEKRGVERFAERVLEFTERIWERIFAGRAGRRAAERAAERAGERAAESAAERMGGRALSRASGIAEKAGERVAERVGERTAERMGERALARQAGKAEGHFSKAARRGVAGHMMELGERASETGVVIASSSGGRKVRSSAAAVRGTERMARSVARVFLIMLPALGGMFALWLLKADLQRLNEVREERDDWEWRTTGTVTRGACFPSVMFGGAALADFVDAISHFVIAYAVLIELGHHKVVLRWEEISMACAILSTVCAVAGEVADYRKKRRNQKLFGGA